MINALRLAYEGGDPPHIVLAMSSSAPCFAGIRSSACSVTHRAFQPLPALRSLARPRAEAGRVRRQWLLDALRRRLVRDKAIPQHLCDRDPQPPARGQIGHDHSLQSARWRVCLGRSARVPDRGYSPLAFAASPNSRLQSQRTMQRCAPGRTILQPFCWTRRRRLRFRRPRDLSSDRSPSSKARPTAI